MLSYKESLKILKETNALLEGHFILSSGMHSDRYVQCAQLLSKPEKAKKICSSLAQLIKDFYPKIDIILSPALGGVVIGYEIGRQLSINTIFAEKHEGELLLRRGFDIPKDSNVLIIEDVITTGKSALECAKIVEYKNSIVVGFACIIDRSNNKCLIKEKIISQVKINIETFDVKSLPKKLKTIEPIKPGSKNLTK